MIKPNFNKSTKEATDLLYSQPIITTMVNVKLLHYCKKIHFYSIQEYCGATRTPLSDFISEEKKALTDGCTIVCDDIYLVLHNDKLQKEEHLNWTRAHEIGHIYLGHLSDGNKEEIEAHFFAAQLLMPELSILEATSKHGRINADDLIEIFGVSDDAANKRILTMSRKTSFSCSEKDKAIWLAQKDNIDLYYDCKGINNSYINNLAFVNEYEHRIRSGIR